MSNEVIVHEDEHDPTVHHEEKDVNVRAILIGIVAFVIFGVVLHFSLWYVWEAFRRMERKKDTTVISQVAGSETRQIPPAPHLQPFPEQPQMGAGEQRNAVAGGAGTELTKDVPRQDPWKATPVVDMEELRSHYDTLLTTYGWVDRNRGLVRIPIEEAKQKLLQKGLPVRTAATLAMPAAVAPVAASGSTAPAVQDPARATEGGIRR